MNRTSREPAYVERAPGVNNLTVEELTRLGRNLKLPEEVREIFRAELAWQRLQEAIKPRAVSPERTFEVQCRSCAKKFEVRLRLLKGVKPPANACFTCRECSGDRSVLDTPSSEIEKLLEGKLPGQKRRVYEVLASTRASRGPYIVDYPNRQFGYSEGAYKPYRREKVKQTAARWRKNNKERAAEHRRRYRRGDRREQFRGVPVDAHAAHAAWSTILEEFGYTCSTPGCGRSLTIKNAIRWRQGATYVPICRSCLGKKAAGKRWQK